MKSISLVFSFMSDQGQIQALFSGIYLDAVKFKESFFIGQNYKMLNGLTFKNVSQVEEYQGMLENSGLVGYAQEVLKETDQSCFVQTAKQLHTR